MSQLHLPAPTRTRSRRSAGSHARVGVNLRNLGRKWSSFNSRARRPALHEGHGGMFADAGLAALDGSTLARNQSNQSPNSFRTCFTPATMFFSFWLAAQRAVWLRP